MKFVNHYALFATLATITLSSSALAAYPERPITLIANAPPGGVTDIIGRIFAEDASKQLGQPVIVVNRPGANGQIGGQYAARQKPDGYTLLMSVDTLLTVNPFIYTKSEFDGRKELDPISMTISFSQTLLSHPSKGYKNLDDFVRAAQTDELTYASAGMGSPGHLTMEYFNQQIKGKLIHVPYQGNAPATNGLVSGQTDVGFLAIGATIGLVNDERLTALAVSTREPNPLTPNAPPIASSGINGLNDFHVEFTYALMAPKGLPQDIALRWSEVIKNTSTNPEISQRLLDMNITPLYSTPTEAAERLELVAKRWEQVIQDAKLSLD